MTKLIILLLSIISLVTHHCPCLQAETGFRCGWFGPRAELLLFVLCVLFAAVAITTIDSIGYESLCEPDSFSDSEADQTCLLIGSFLYATHITSIILSGKSMSSMMTTRCNFFMDIMY